MPGSALWLLPPDSSQTEKSLVKLTTDIIPSFFPGDKKYHLLLPHLTLTSGIPDSVTDDESIPPEKWLESLFVSLTAPPIVGFQALDVGEQVTRKLTLRVAKEPMLVELAIQLRTMAVEGGNREAAASWARTTWAPHVSLLYGDLKIGEEKRLQVMKTVGETGLRIDAGDEGPMQPAYTRWEGGKVVWVDTRGEIEGWRILARRELEFGTI